MNTLNTILSRPYLRQFSLIRISYTFFCLAMGMFLLVIIKLLSVFVRIRVGQLEYSRIGHLAGNTEYYLRTIFSKKRPWEIHILLCIARPANSQIVDMIKRKVPVIESNLLVAIYARTREKWPDSPVWVNLDTTGPHDYGLWSNSTPQLSFAQTEETRGRQLLQSMGIPPGEPFVCFAIRDKSYLEKTQKGGEGFWRYHDYRDADIENCRLMAEWLASQGIWVLRMGAIVEKPFMSDNPRIIDYATKFRTDFGDIYLLGHCKFFVGDTAGIFWISWIFDIPIALCNQVPLTHLYVRPNSITMPKQFRKKYTTDYLTYDDVVAKGYDGFLQTKEYDNAGIELIENSPNEILGMVKELMARLDGFWITTPDDESLHDSFWKSFPYGHTAQGCLARVPIDFLRRNSHLIRSKW